MLNDRQQAELDFWKADYALYEGQDYAKIRASNFQRIAARFPEVISLVGNGLDVGCGPVSMFEGSGLSMMAVDPLLEEYQKIYMPAESTVLYVPKHKDDGILHFPDEFFDFLFCINVVDHTNHYRTLIVEMHRVLKPKGRLYFMVNFDDHLYMPHHTLLWGPDIVAEEFRELHMLTNEYNIGEVGQCEYWATYEKGR